MASKEPLSDPHIAHHVIESVEDELQALRAFVRFHWPWVLVMLLGVALALYAIRPFPSRTVTIATGQPKSSYDGLGNLYREFFARHGVELRLVPTNGPLDNVDVLAKDEVDAAFAIGGVPVPAGRGIVSLGSIQFEPLWLFYRGEPLKDPDALEFLRQRRLSIGPVGSGTRYVVLDLMKQHSFDSASRANLVEMPAQEAADALRAGTIDGMFLVAGMESPLLRELLADPALNLWDFRTAKAIAGRLPHIYPVVYPMGAASLSPVRPAGDVNLVATNTKVLVREDLHPAIQYLFMMAAIDFYGNRRFYFDRADGFPVFLDHDVPKSDVATKYLEHHSTSLERTFPFWLASLLDRAWLLLAALVAILLPLARLIPEYRKLHFSFVVEEHYASLRRIYRELNEESGKPGFEKVNAEFRALANQIAGMWVPAGLTEKYHFLVGALELLRARIRDAEAKLAAR
jgi:hypothetical protein